MEQLGFHTLAILHAGSYIATTRCSVAEYLNFMRTNRRRLLDKSRGQGQSRYDTVYATFGASIEFLEQRKAGEADEARKDALQLLEVLSTFHYTSAPLDVLVDASKGVKKALKTPKEREMFLDELTAWHVAQVPDLVRSEEGDVRFRTTEAVARLESLALVRTDPSGRAWKSVSMHPLVHGWAGDRRSPRGQKETLRMTECIFALSSSTIESWGPYHRQSAPHLKRLVERDKWMVDDASESRCVLQAYVQMAKVYHEMDIHPDMHELTGRIMQRLGLDDEKPTEELRELYRVFAAAIHREGSRPAHALRALEAIARLDENMLAENDPRRLDNLRALGNARLKNGQTKEAAALLRKVVKARQELGEEHPDLLASQHDLAKALMEDGQNKDAITLLEEVVGIMQGLLPEDSPSRHPSHQALAVAYLQDGQIAEATRRLEEAERVEARTLGEQHPTTAHTQNWLADAYHRAGRLADAIALYERVVNTRTLVLGERHPDLLTSQNNLAFVFSDAGRSLDAINILKRVVAISNKTLDNTDRDRLLVQYNLGYIYLVNGPLLDAIDILERAVDIGKSTFGEKDSDLLAAQHNLALAYLNSGRVTKAIMTLEGVVKVRRLILKDSDFALRCSQYILGRAYLKAGKALEAISILERLVEVGGMLHDQDRLKFVVPQGLLDEAYATRDRYLADSTSSSASENTPPNPAISPKESNIAAETINGPIVDPEGQASARSTKGLEGEMSTSLVLSDPDGHEV